MSYGRTVEQRPVVEWSCPPGQEVPDDVWEDALSLEEVRCLASSTDWELVCARLKTWCELHLKLDQTDAFRADLRVQLKKNRKLLRKTPDDDQLRQWVKDKTRELLLARATVYRLRTRLSKMDG